MKNLLLYCIAVLFAAGCAKKENITPEAVEIISPVAEKVDSSLINIETTAFYCLFSISTYWGWKFSHSCLSLCVE